MSPKGHARSTAEMRFYVSLEPCPQCGKRIDPDPLSIYGDNESASIEGGDVAARDVLKAWGVK